ncbi:hypothetical protein C0J45_3053 [Silurus meridionalis]|uniref:RRM domain-containing protein n=1 Tax=Silurus meridionalis TaxID=175797 RepID=A0A8T0BWT7_SILME|nr:hypothetical protein HF521_016680 [Silurus meridionalis]KAI5107415.1 hypothetical protein C0J45_3053 [Silurus meridionalis]
MSQEHLSKLAVININHAIAGQICNNDVIDDFASNKARKVVEQKVEEQLEEEQKVEKQMEEEPMMVMMENGRSKVIGYVTFSSADEAGVAILEMNGRVLGSRTVYLSPSQTTQGQSHGMKVETISPSKPCPDPRPNANKNIHPQSDLFLPYRNITSAKVTYNH